MIALVNYGVGNLRSVEKALQSVGAQVRVTSNPEIIRAAEKVVLPGVGAFGDGMAGLIERGLVEPLRRSVEEGKPLLGICLGMQLLLDRSEERGVHAGLGLLPGQVRRFLSAELKIPQTGWNQILPTRPSPLLDGLPSRSYAYFNHSFYCDLAAEDTLAQTEYGITYCSVLGRDHIFGVQFHPEKSQQIGLALLRNFVELC